MPERIKRPRPVIKKVDTQPAQSADDLERTRLGLSVDQWEQYQQFCIDHPEPAPAPEPTADPEPEVTGIRNMIAAFEAGHNIAELYAITDLTAEEAMAHVARKAAKEDLNVLLSRIQALKTGTAVDSKTYDELFAKYRYFSRAIGMHSNGKLDHTR